MPAITIRNIPDDLYDRLKRRATENRRSVNSEIILCIEQAVKNQGQDDIADLIAKARKIRKKMSGRLFTDEDFTELKTIGRP